MPEPMQWSIYLDTNGEYDDWSPDYKTDIPDGVYDVYFPYIDKLGKGCGVMIEDGYFVPTPTIAAITDARDMVAYWGVYIEDMLWNGDLKAFTVSIGS